MKICIVRHGSAVSGAVQDQNRGLTERGEGQAVGAGHWLAQQAFNNPRILASPFLRARQTAQAIADFNNAAFTNAVYKFPLHISKAADVAIAAVAQPKLAGI